MGKSKEFQSDMDKISKGNNPEIKFWISRLTLSR